MEFLDLPPHLLSSQALLDLLRPQNSFSPLKNFQKDKNINSSFLWKIILLLGFPNRRKFRTLLRAESCLSDLSFAQIASAFYIRERGIYNIKSILVLT